MVWTPNYPFNVAVLRILTNCNHKNLCSLDFQARLCIGLSQLLLLWLQLLLSLPKLVPAASETALTLMDPGAGLWLLYSGNVTIPQLYATYLLYPFISFYTPWCGSIAFPKEQPKCGILESIQLYAPLGFHFSVDLCVNLHGMDPLTQCTGCQRDVWPKGKARPNLEVRMARCKLQRITGNALPKPTELLAPTSEWNWSPWWTSRSSAELCLWCCPWEIARK